MENQAEGVSRGGVAGKAASEVFAQTPPRQSGLHQGDQGVSRQTGLGQRQVWQLIQFAVFAVQFFNKRTIKVCVSCF